MSIAMGQEIADEAGIVCVELVNACFIDMPI